jgi:hypothetical protein
MSVVAPLPTAPTCEKVPFRRARVPLSLAASDRMRLSTLPTDTIFYIFVIHSLVADRLELPEIARQRCSG